MSQRPARRRGRGRRALLILLLLTVFGAAFLWWSNRSLQVDRFTYASPRLPAGFDGCVAVQLSDLHGALFGENNQDLIDAVRAENPDYIFLTGDLLDRYRRTPQSYAVDLGRAMAAIAPTYFVTGNHEWALPDVPGLKAQLEEAGVTVLSNEFTTLERNGDAIVLAGIDDPNGYADQKTPEELAAEVEAACPDAFWLLLALAYLIPHGTGLLVAALLLNCPAFGLFSLLSQLLGWGSGGSLWAHYIGGLVTGLLPPLLYLMGSYIPITALDDEEDLDEEFIEKQ